ncbi:MAG: PAS domain S-box protein [Gemmatimonadaceae bacterium]|nr:PAS domain S-box protein [Gemmatimonadaceae bacterium]
MPDEGTTGGTDPRAANAMRSIWPPLAGIVLAVAVPLSLLTAYTIRELARDARDQARLEVEGVARIVGSRVEDFVREQQTILSLVASTVGADTAVPAGELDQLLRRIDDRLPEYIRYVGVYRPDGSNVAHAYPYAPGEVRPSVGDRAYFRNAIATRRFAVGEPVVSRITGRRVVGSALPVVSASGEIVRLVTVSSELDHLLEMLAVPQFPGDAVVAVLDTLGFIVTRSLDPERWVGRDLSADSSVQQILRERRGSGQFFGIDSIHRFGAYLPAAGTPWLIFVATPTALLAGVERDVLLRSSLLAGFVLTAALLLAAYMARGLGRPIGRLIVDARALGRGEAGRRADVNASGPLRPLARAFNRMADDLTERTQSLERMEARYRYLFERNPGAMWVYDDTSLAILAVNSTAVTRYGWTHEEFLSMTIVDIRPPEDVPLMHMSRLQSEEQRVHVDEPFRHLRKDGSIMLVSVTAIPIEFDGKAARLVLADDVTQRVTAERALRVSEEQYRMVTDGIPLLIGDVSATGTLNFVNRAFTAFFGREREALIGMSFADLFPPDARTILQSRTRTIADGSAIVFETTLLRADGKEARCMVSLVHRTATPTKATVGATAGAAAGQPVSSRVVASGHFVVISDVSERAELETQLRHSQKLDAVGQLAGGVAHDFNNLLTVILSHATFAREEVASRPELRRIGAPLTESLTEITSAGERAATLTRQLLAFSRRQPLASRVIDLNAVTLGVDRMLRRLLGEHIEMVTLLAPGIGAAEADPGQIEQILVNLAVNARDAMPRGGRLTIETANVTLDEAYAATRADVTPGEYVMLAVSDNGVGMSSEVLDHVFEPFFTTKPAGQGTGLGLAVCYGIAKQHGGHLAGYSELGQGATFRLYLPRVARSVDSVLPKADVPTSRGTESVLLVEDTYAVRAVAARALATHGYQVVSAADGLEALRLVSAMERPMDLLITDLMMPHMGGRELAEELLRQSPGLRVLYMSGYTQQAADGLGEFTDSLHYLPKPFVPSELLRRVREVLDLTPPGKPVE